jgi:ribose-phosphate pyrophosphokinase
MQKLTLFTGNANPKLARDIASYLDVALGKADVGNFSDGEVAVDILENVRGRDCFVLQSTCAPANSHLMELLVMIDALKRASARRITAVIPYYGYARQDRKAKPRAPITAKLVANLITTAGADRALCMDLHAGQIQGFFDIPVDNLYATPVLLEAIRRKDLDDLTIISPDAGGVERARAFAKRLDATLAIIDKRRERANVAEVMHIIGDVKGRDCVIVDDMVDTAGTLTEAARCLQEEGAASVCAAITHPVLSGPAIKRISESPLESLITTDTIPLRPDVDCSKIEVVSVAAQMGEAIRRINNEESVSSLFV